MKKVHCFVLLDLTLKFDIFYQKINYLIKEHIFTGTNTSLPIMVTFQRVFIKVRVKELTYVVSFIT